jgi:hypothetical protein
MISQTLLFIGLHVLGVAICLALGPRHRPHLCAALGFTTGLAAMVGLEIAMLATGIRFGVLSASVAAALVLTACLLQLRREHWPDRHSWQTIARWTVGFALAALVLSSRNLAILSYDSHFLVMLGGVIARDGVITPGLLEQMGLYGSFQVLAQSLVCFSNKSFLYALAPVFAASTAAVFAVVLNLALDALRVRMPGRRLVVGLVTVATFTSYMLFRHSFYIHTNFGVATYLFIFCTLLWLAEVEQDASAMPLAFIACFALSIQRIEAPLVCALFIGLTVVPSGLPARRILPSYAGFVLAMVGWYVLLGTEVPMDGKFLTPARCYLMAAIQVALLGYYALAHWRVAAFLQRLNRWAPAVIVVVIAGALVAMFTLRYEHMSTSANAWAQTLWEEPYWEGTWVAIVGLAALGLLAPAPPARWSFVCGIPAYMGLILLLVWSRAPYYVHIGDSASRMAIHLVPLAFFYFALKFVPLLAESALARPHHDAPAEPPEAGNLGEAVVD